MLEAVLRHTTEIANMAQPELERLKVCFSIEEADIRPRVYSLRARSFEYRHCLGHL